MNPMQQMLQRAQKMQRDLAKAKAELASKEFKVSKNGMVEIVMGGDKKVKSLKIEKDAIDPENADILSDTIAMAINEVIAQVEEANNKAEENVTGNVGGLF